MLLEQELTAPATPSERPHKRRPNRAVLAPLLLVLALLAVFLSNPHFVESTDSVGNELLPLSVLRYGSITFDQYYVPPRADGSYPTGQAAIVPGSVPQEFAYRVLPEVPEKSFPWWFVRVNGHTLSLYPIAPGLANTPVFAIADLLHVDLDRNVATLTRISTSIIAAVSVLAMYLALVQVVPRRGAAVYLTLAFGIGTAVWSANSRSLYQHGLATLFIAAGFAALLTRRPRLLALAGLLFGCAFATRPTNALFLAAIALYVWRHHRHAFPGYAALAAIPVLLLTWYSWVYLGNPLALGQGQGLSGFTAGEAPIAFIGLLISPNRGLLFFSPIFIFSVVYAIHLLRTRSAPPLLAYISWSSLALVGLYSLWAQWPGGHTYGYRFLIELTPGLMLLLAHAWPRVIEPSPLLRGLFLLAFAASVYVHGLGAEAAPCGFDDTPNDIDAHHERLWDVADGEIARCTRYELKYVQARAQSG